MAELSNIQIQALEGLLQRLIANIEKINEAIEKDAPHWARNKDNVKKTLKALYGTVKGIYEIKPLSSTVKPMLESYTAIARALVHKQFRDATEFGNQFKNFLKRISLLIEVLRDEQELERPIELLHNAQNELIQR